MRITELLKKEAIALGVRVDSKEAAVDYLVNLQNQAGNISDPQLYKEGILAREQNGSTAIGEGIAIPHAKSAAVIKPGLAAMTVPDGVDYESLDGQPSNLFFMIAAPEKGGDVHLEVLSRLSILLMDENFRKNLLAAKTKEEFLGICDKAELEKFADELDEQETSSNVGADGGNKKTAGNYPILAVTACPTGIAHTYMAAEALEKKGAELGYPVKAETNGSGGAKNVLTKDYVNTVEIIFMISMKRK